MAQRYQFHDDGSDRLWLASLIESYEWASRDDVRDAPCDRALLCAAWNHLARPMPGPGQAPLEPQALLPQQPGQALLDQARLAS